MAGGKPIVKTAADLSPAPLLDKIKAFATGAMPNLDTIKSGVDAPSASGLLRDQKKLMDAKLTASGG